MPEPTDARAEPTGGRWVWWVNWVGLAIGLVGLAWMLDEIGWDVVVAQARAASGAVALTVALDVVATVLRARALHIYFRPSQRMVSLGRVVIAQAAGGAMGAVTPTGALGEATKATLLLSRMPAQQVISGLIAYQVIALYVSGSLLVVGGVIAAASGSLPTELGYLVLASTAVVVVLIGVITWIVHRGLVRTVLDVGAKVRAISRERRDRWTARLHELDERARAVRGHGRAVAFEAYVELLAAKLINWLQTWIVMDAVGVEVSEGVFVAVILAGSVVSRIASVLPLGIGIGDAGTAALYRVLGLGAGAGVLVTLLLRVRLIITAVLGLAAMLGLQLYDRIGLYRTRARLRARRAAAP